MLAGCNVALFVSKDNVIKKEKGYIVITYHSQYIEFIPSKIDTNLTLSENLAKYHLETGVYLNGLFPKEVDYLKIFGDTVYNGWIVVPVAIEYRQKKEVDYQQKNKNQEHYIKIKTDNVIYKYQINTHNNIQYINALPFLSEKDKSRKIEDYEVK